MGLQRVPDGLDSVVAGVLPRQPYVIAKNSACAHINDHEQPDAFHLEFVLKSKQIMHDHLEPDIKRVTVEFNRLIWARRRRRGRFVVRARQALEVRCVCRASGSGHPCLHEFLLSAEYFSAKGVL